MVLKMSKLLKDYTLKNKIHLQQYYIVKYMFIDASKKIWSFAKLIF